MCFLVIKMYFCSSRPQLCQSLNSDVAVFCSFFKFVCVFFYTAVLKMKCKNPKDDYIRCIRRWLIDL